MTAMDEPVLTLTEGAARVDLYPGVGGRIGQITIGDRRLLRGPEHADVGWPWWGSYPMLPWVNRIAGGVAHFEGDTITVPVNWPDGTAIHGLACAQPWQIVSTGDRQATLAIEADHDRYHVRSTQQFSLAADALDLDIELVNLAPWRVPVGIGIHPWFVAAPVRVPADLIWPGDGPDARGPAASGAPRRGPP